MDFDQRAQTWDEDPEKVTRAGEIADAVRRRLDLTDRPRTLELGAGTGLLARALADDLGPTTLADSSPGMLDAARAAVDAAGLGGWEVVLVDVDSGDLPSGPYGLVISQLALHHMTDVPAVLAAAYSRLVPGGRLAMADLDLDDDGAFHAEHPEFTGHHGFDREHVATWLEAAGFEQAHLETATAMTHEVDGVPRDFPLFLATAFKPA